MKNTIRITLATLLLSLVACKTTQPPVATHCTGKAYVPHGK